jgi:hypothetical protein
LLASIIPRAAFKDRPVDREQDSYILGGDALYQSSKSLEARNLDEVYLGGHAFLSEVFRAVVESICMVGKAPVHLVVKLAALCQSVVHLARQDSHGQRLQWESQEWTEQVAELAGKVRMTTAPMASRGGITGLFPGRIIRSRR